MLFLDLSHTLHPDFPTWDSSCGFRAHIELDYPDGNDLASLPLENLIEPAVIIDVRANLKERLLESA